MTQPSSQDQPAGKAPEDYAEDARTLDAYAFRERHGNGFFIYDGSRPLRLPGDAKKMLLKSEQQVTMDFRAPMRARGSHVVIPVRKSDRSPVGGFISVGRTRNNDVVLADESVSRFHALIVSGDDGQFSVSDAGSTNGTYVDDKEIPSARESAKRELLRSGAKVRFGHVDLLFLDAAGLRELAKRQAAR
ncbi:MAG: FHA domain-containing protein [Pseudomonadota bacterium]